VTSVGHLCPSNTRPQASLRDVVGFTQHESADDPLCVSTMSDHDCLTEEMLHTQMTSQGSMTDHSTHRTDVLHTRTDRQTDILEPFFDVIELVHWNGVDHRYFAVVVLVDKDHVKVLEMKLNAFKVNKFHLIQRNHQWRLNTRQ